MHVRVGRGAEGGQADFLTESGAQTWGSIPGPVITTRTETKSRKLN